MAIGFSGKRAVCAKEKYEWSHCAFAADGRCDDDCVLKLLLTKTTGKLGRLSMSCSSF